MSRGFFIEEDYKNVMRVDQLRDSEKITILQKSTGLILPNLSDLYVAKFGSSRLSDIIAKIGRTGEPKEKVLNDYLRSLFDSFERDAVGAANIPLAWTAYTGSGSPSYKGVANDFSSDGAKSFKITAAADMDGGIKVQIPCGANDNLTLSVFVKTDATVVNAGVVLATDISGGGINTVNNVGANNNGRIFINKNGGFNLGYAAIFLSMGSFGATSHGNVWYDDIRLMRG